MKVFRQAPRTSCLQQNPLTDAQGTLRIRIFTFQWETPHRNEWGEREGFAVKAPVNRDNITSDLSFQDKMKASR